MVESLEKKVIDAVLSLIDLTGTNAVKVDNWALAADPSAEGGVVTAEMTLEQQTPNAADAIANITIAGQIFARIDPDKSLIRNLYDRAMAAAVSALSSYQTALDITAPAAAVFVTQASQSAIRSSADFHAFTIDYKIVFVNVL